MHCYKIDEAGVDAITFGDHIYRCKEIIPTLTTSNRIVKPANYPGDAPGRKAAVKMYINKHYTLHAAT